MPGAEAAPPVVVLDASVAVRWVVPEVGSEEADELLRRPLSWITPRLMLSEVSSALRRKAAAGELRVEHAAEALDTVLSAVASGTIRLADDEDLVAPALMMALSLGHTVPDCLYLVLAEREGAGLATADRKLGALARRRGIVAHLVPSA
jgi:predicted nucleic acid-binding protein